MSTRGAKITRWLNALAASMAGAVLILALGCRWPVPPAVSWPAAGAANITAVALSAAGDRLVCGDATGRVVLYDSQSGRELARWQSADSRVTALVLSSDDRMLAVAHGEGDLVCWDVETQTALLRHRLPEICALEFSPDGSSLALASQSGTCESFET